MEEKRERQIINQIADEFKQQNSWLSFQVPVGEAEETAIDIAEHLALKLIFHSGRNQPASFVGRRKFCFALKKQLGGKVKYGQNFSVWSGIASKEQIIKTINEACTPAKK